MSNSNSTKGNHDFDESDEEYPRGEFGSSKWSSTSSSLSSSAANETATNQIDTPKQDLLDSKLVEYLLEHKNDITLDTIKAIQGLLSDLKLSTPSKGNIEHISDLRAKYFASDDANYIKKELDELKESKRRREKELEITKKVHSDVLKSLDNTKVDDIFKNNGAKEYVQTLKDRIRLKEESVVMLKSELDHLRKEVDSLRDRCTRATKLSNHYFQLFKESETARAKLEIIPITRERSMNERMFISSPANSFDDNHVPPPPPIDMPAIDEMMESAKSPPMMSMHSFSSQPSRQNHDSRYNTSTNNSQYNSFGLLDNSIPPPPLDDVDLDEIFGHISRSEQQQQQQQQMLSPTGSMHDMNRFSGN